MGHGDRRGMSVAYGMCLVEGAWSKAYLSNVWRGVLLVVLVGVNSIGVLESSWLRGESFANAFDGIPFFMRWGVNVL